MHQFDNVPLTLNPLMRAADGNFYGTSRDGGPGDSGTVAEDHSRRRADGPSLVHARRRWRGPGGRLIQATDGNLYGTTSAGGTLGAGVIFKVTPDGVLTTLYSFSSFATGLSPAAGVIQAERRPLLRHDRIGWRLVLWNDLSDDVRRDGDGAAFIRRRRRRSESTSRTR